MIKDIQKEDLFQNYILAGGTALALQLGHRTSEDIDLCALKDCPIIKPLVKDEGITMFDSEEIAAMKINAICDRKEPKDYIDIAYMLDKKTSLDNILNIHMKKYNNYTLMLIKKNLSAYTGINPYKWQDVKILDQSFFIGNIPNIIDSALKEFNKKNNIQKETILSKFRRFINK
jgi:predicted nucleotidyltransferase component of viral defense system